MLVYEMKILCERYFKYDKLHDMIVIYHIFN